MHQKPNKVLLFFLLSLILGFWIYGIYFMGGLLVESFDRKLEFGLLEVIYSLLIVLSVFICIKVVLHSYSQLHTILNEYGIEKRFLFKGVQKYTWMQLQNIDGYDQTLYFYFDDGNEIKLHLWYFKDMEGISRFAFGQARQSPYLKDKFKKT